MTRLYEDLIIDIPDYPEPGVVFKDVTPVFADARAFAGVIDDLAEHFIGYGVTKVLGAEARGFMVGSSVAYRLGLCQRASRASCHARWFLSPMRWNTAPIRWRFTPTRLSPAMWC